MNCRHEGLHLPLDLSISRFAPLLLPIHPSQSDITTSPSSFPSLSPSPSLPLLSLLGSGPRMQILCIAVDMGSGSLGSLLMPERCCGRAQVGQVRWGRGAGSPPPAFPSFGSLAAAVSDHSRYTHQALQAHHAIPSLAARGDSMGFKHFPCSVLDTLIATIPCLGEALTLGVAMHQARWRESWIGSIKRAFPGGLRFRYFRLLTVAVSDHSRR